MPPPLVSKEMDLDALDEVIARAQGWTEFRTFVNRRGKWMRSLPGTPAFRRMTNPTRDWGDFGRLLLWCAEKGLPVAVRRSEKWGGDKWTASVADQTKQSDTDPRVALALAVKAWKEGS